MSHPTKTPLILILDDDERMQMLVARILERAGFATARAATVKELQERATRHRVAAFVIDVHLVGESGLEALRWLRRSRRYVATPALVLTVDVNLSAESHAIIQEHRAHIFYKHAPLELLREYLQQLIVGRSHDG